MKATVTAFSACLTLISSANFASAQEPEPSPERPPNFVVIFCDDLGYGDLGVTDTRRSGHPSSTGWRARDSAGPISIAVLRSALRVGAGLITGRLPIRTGLCSSKRHVLFPNSGVACRSAKRRSPKCSRRAAYATACVGKWHLGHLPQFLPTKHGFDEYFGIPYSNDMTVKRRGDPPLPLMKNDKVIDAGVDQRTLTKRYTEYAVDFIRRQKDKPFFLYYPQTFPHIPLFASDDFRGKSPRGLYGDVVEEIDWSVGQILAELRKSGLAKNTLVLLRRTMVPGSALASAAEARACCAAARPRPGKVVSECPGSSGGRGRIKPATTARGLGSTLDLLPTMASLAGAKLDPKRILDGVDLSPALLGRGSESADRNVLLPRLASLRPCAKARTSCISGFGVGRRLSKVDPPQLYRLDRDPGEQREIGKKHPKIVESLLARVKQFEASFKAPPSQLEIPLPKK